MVPYIHQCILILLRLNKNQNCNPIKQPESGLNNVICFILFTITSEFLKLNA